MVRFAVVFATAAARSVASDVERARCLDQIRTAVRTFLPQTRLTDWCADGGNAALIEQGGGELGGQAALASSTSSWGDHA